MLRILNRYVPLRNIVFFFMETGIIYTSVIVGTYLRFLGDISQLQNYEALLLKALLVTLVVQVSLYYFDLYDFRATNSTLELGIRLLQALGTASISLAVIYYLFPQTMIGRGIFFVSLIVLLAIIVSWRLVYNWILKTQRFSERVLLVGTGEMAQNIARDVLGRKDCGFHIVGFVTRHPDRVGNSIVNPQVLGTYEEIPQVVKAHRIDRIVVSMNDRRGNMPIDELIQCRMDGVTVEEGAVFYERLAGKLCVETLRPSYLIFSDGFRVSPFARFTKRATGLLVAGMALGLLFPVLILVAILIKIDSPGPIFYRQKRVGQDGKGFTLYKFRSMVENAETNGAQWAEKDDPRITRVGRILRKIRFDEIPQLINVFKGDMSIVGPRPERPVFVEQLAKRIPFYNQRHSVKPGITGWAQICYPYGSSEKDALEKLKYDLYYIKNISLAFDLTILFQTIKVVLFAKGSR